MPPFGRNSPPSRKSSLDFIFEVATNINCEGENGIFEKPVVCVLYANTFLGAWTVSELLDQGCTVKAVVSSSPLDIEKALNATESIQALKKIAQGKAGDLHICEVQRDIFDKDFGEHAPPVDCMGYYSYLLKNCNYLIYTPLLSLCTIISEKFRLNATKRMEKTNELIRELKVLLNVANVLNIKRVVIASSVGSVVGNEELVVDEEYYCYLQNKIYTERNWYRGSDSLHIAISKVEKAILDHSGLQDFQSELLFINAGAMIGPSLLSSTGKTDGNEELHFILTSGFFPFTCDLNWPIVDVRDVAKCQVATCFIDIRDLDQRLSDNASICSSSSTYSLGLTSSSYPSSSSLSSSLTPSSLSDSNLPLNSFNDSESSGSGLSPTKSTGNYIQNGVLFSLDEIHREEQAQRKRNGEKERKIRQNQKRLLCVSKTVNLEKTIQLLKKEGIDGLSKLPLDICIPNTCTRKLLKALRFKNPNLFFSSHVGISDTFSSKIFENILGLSFHIADDTIMAAVWDMVKWGYLSTTLKGKEKCIERKLNRFMEKECKGDTLTDPYLAYCI